MEYSERSKNICLHFQIKLKLFYWCYLSEVWKLNIFIILYIQQANLFFFHSFIILMCTVLILLVVFLSKRTNENRWESKLNGMMFMVYSQEKRVCFERAWFLEKVHFQRLHTAWLHLTFLKGQNCKDGE